MFREPNFEFNSSVSVFAFIVCIAFGAPWWVFVIGFFCLLIDNG